jgi:transglutaminase-like putative cysteine protease
MSWRLRIGHSTGYRYDDEVVSSYNEARLTPHTSLTQLTLESRVKTTPEAKQYRYWDYWGTQVTAFDVQEPHSALEVTARSVVDTSAASPPPHDVPDWQTLRDPHERDRHIELLSPTPRTTSDDEMSAAALAAARDLAPREAVTAVTDLVHGAVTYERGSTRVQTSAAEAWRQRRGVCQDIAHVSLTMLRELGIPSRYVSGYLHPDADAEIGATVVAESHAWIEVWLGSWWGYDPTNAIPAGSRHVLVAHGREYGDVPPLKGIYSGSGSHALGVQVELTRLA